MGARCARVCPQPRLWHLAAAVLWSAPMDMPIDDSADPYSVEAVRASMGAIFTQAVAIARWEEFVPWLRSGPGQLVGTSLKTDKDYLAVTYKQPCFLLIGNESQGLPESYEAECDLLVKMPMLGRADSLNAAVAAAVMAFQVRASWRNG